MILGYDALYALKFIEDAYKFMIRHRRIFKEKCLKDKLFGYKSIYTLNQYFQHFLGACLDADSIVDINTSYFNLSYIGQSVVHLKFHCDLPTVFTDLSFISAPSKSPKLEDYGDTVKKDLEWYIRNEFSRPE